MGGMAAQIPIKNDPAANETALEKVRQDKLREVRAGHDGTWVAHPGLVPIAQGDLRRVHADAEPDRRASARTCTSRRRICWRCPTGDITEDGLRLNIDVGMQYLEVVAARQRLRADLQPDGRRGHRGDLARAGLAMGAARREAERRPHGDVRSWCGRRSRNSSAGSSGVPGDHYDQAAKLFEKMMTRGDFPDFLTLPAYEYL